MGGDGGRAGTRRYVRESQVNGTEGQRKMARL